MADGSVIIDTELDSSGLGKGLASLGKVTAAGLTAAVSALSALGTGAVKVGIDFESAFAGVKKTIDGTPQYFEELRGEILDLSKTIPIAATEIAGIAESAGQLGIGKEYLSEFTEVMANLGVATNMTSDEAATSLARLANITQMSQEDFGRLGSTIVALGNNLATTESEITNMALRIAGTGKQVDMSEDQILAMAGAFSSVGIEAEAGGSAVSRVLSMMQLACENGGGTLEQLAAVAGMTGDQFKQSFETDAAAAFQSFINGLNNAEASGKSAIAVISELGENQDLAAMDTVVIRDAMLRAAGASNVLADSLEIGAQAWDENTALVNEAEQRYGTMESQLQLLKNTATDLGITVYDQLREPLKEVVGTATDMVDQLSTAMRAGGLEGLASAVGDVLAQVVTNIANFAPKMAESALSLIDSFMDGLITSAPAIADAAVDIGILFVDAFFSITADLVELGAELLLALAEGITANSGAITNAALEGITGLIEAFVQYAPMLITAGADMIVALTNGLIAAVPQLLASIPGIIDALVIGLVESSVAIVNAAAEIVTALIEALPEIIQALIDYLPELLQLIVDSLVEATPILLEAVIQVVNALMEALPDILLMLIEVLPTLVQGICDGLMELLPQIIQAGITLLTALVADLPTIINTILLALPSIIHDIVGSLLQMVPQLVQCGVELLVSLVQALPEIIYGIVSVLPIIIESVVSTLVSMIPLLIQCGIELLTSLVAALPEILITISAVLPQIVMSIIQALIDCIPQLIQCGVELLTSLIADLPGIIQAILMHMPTIITSIIDALVSNIPQLIQCGVDLFMSLITNLPTIIIELVKAIPQIISALVGALGEGVGQFVEIGGNLVRGLWEGIQGLAGWIWDKVSGWASSLWGGIKDFFGIASPSKLFKNVLGKNLMLGLAEGIADEAHTAMDAALAVSKDIADIDFETKPVTIPGPDDVDFDALVAEAKSTVNAETADTGTTVSAGSAHGIYRDGDDGPDPDSKPENSGKPQYVQNDIHIDGKKTARVLTPYVAKELDWEGK